MKKMALLALIIIIAVLVFLTYSFFRTVPDVAIPEPVPDSGFTMPIKMIRLGGFGYRADSFLSPKITLFPDHFEYKVFFKKHSHPYTDVKLVDTDSYIKSKIAVYFTGSSNYVVTFRCGNDNNCDNLLRFFAGKTVPLSPNVAKRVGAELAGATTVSSEITPLIGANRHGVTVLFIIFGIFAVLGMVGILRGPSKSTTGTKNDNGTAAPLGKRQARPEVTPLVYQGVKFEAINNGPIGTGKKVRATVISTGEIKWEKVVFTPTFDPKMEADVQDVNISDIYVSGGRLEVTNEHGEHFELSLESGELYSTHL